MLEALAAAGVTLPARCLALPDQPIEHGDPNAQKKAFGLDAEGIARAVQALLAEHPDAEGARGSTSAWSRTGSRRARSRAEALIRAGQVLVDDAPVDKPGTRVRAESQVRLRGEPRRFVSRGGDKLAGALADLAVDPAGKRCLDVGASTGGFTDCLLAAGARRVVAVDVGYGQLAPRLREDPRVVVLERRNARSLEPADVQPPVELVTVDVSFISLRLLLPVLLRVAPDAELAGAGEAAVRGGQGARRQGRRGARRGAARAGGGGACARRRRRSGSRCSARPRAGSRGRRAIGRCSCTFARVLRAADVPPRESVDARGADPILCG